ncbi:hypothetical protein [Haloarcula pelagica]|uniref:hypothetical protein n=1 Tax=Haloarcula pelagica TaxID=3033389 RepID=UPI0024C2E196|nr:hypothetical protein [Halomicroarcula sp. YJ-61-S]
MQREFVRASRLYDAEASEPREFDWRQTRLITDGGCRETHIGESGLFVPSDLREFEGQVVFRTPRSTIQHFGSTDLDAYYGMVEPGDFGDPDQFRDAQNPGLAPDRLTIKPRGEDPVEFVVETDPDVRCDGGSSWKHLGNRWAHSEEYRCTECGRERSISNRSDQYQEHGEPEPCGCTADQEVAR